MAKTPLPFFYLIYTSQAVKLMQSDDLISLLNQSRRNNAVLGLTGMLLYMESRLLTKLEGRFIQVLEGYEPEVRLIYERILSDTRNRGILLLSCGHCDERYFPDWSMGYCSFSKPQGLETDNYFHLGDDFPARLNLAGNGCRRQLLLYFYALNTFPGDLEDCDVELPGSQRSQNNLS